MAKILKKRVIESSGSLPGQATAKALSASRRSTVLHKETLESRHQVDAIIEATQEKARRIINEAETTKGHAEEVYRAEALRGYQDGLSQARQEIAAAFQQLAQRQAEWFDAMESEVVTLALDIAKRIIGHEAAHQKEAMIGMIRQALGEYRRLKPLRIFLHPTDRARVQGDLMQRLGLEEPPEVVDDPTIAPGGCRLETPIGSIDATLDTQLAVIREALLAK